MKDINHKINIITRLNISFVFFYHGLIPKILFLDETEVLMINSHHYPFTIQSITLVAGITEILIACAILIFKKSLIPIYLAMVILLVLSVDILIVNTNLITQAFNPVSTNIMALSLCYLSILTHNRLHNDNSGSF